MKDIPDNEFSTRDHLEFILICVLFYLPFFSIILDGYYLEGLIFTYYFTFAIYTVRRF